jgi:hypothetical protein
VARWPRAIWQPGAPCSGTLRPIAVCLHHQAGSGNPLNVYISRRVSAHFWIPRTGAPVQHVDTAVQAWHGVAHNGYSIGVETEGCGSPPHADPLTENQLALFGELMAWARATHGIPLQLSESVSQPGLNYHRCQGGPATGCPCDVRKNARGEILRRAGGAAPAPAPPPTAPAPAPSPGAAPPFPGRILRRGVKGADVAQYQARMIARGWGAITAAGGADGDFGPTTETVTRQFQAEKALAVDGEVGPQTWAAAWTAPVS